MQTSILQLMINQDQQLKEQSLDLLANSQGLEAKTECESIEEFANQFKDMTLLEDHEQRLKTKFKHYGMQPLVIESNLTDFIKGKLLNCNEFQTKISHINNCLLRLFLEVRTGSGKDWQQKRYWINIKKSGQIIQPEWANIKHLNEYKRDR